MEPLPNYSATAQRFALCFVLALAATVIGSASVQAMPAPVEDESEPSIETVGPQGNSSWTVLGHATNSCGRGRTLFSSSGSGAGQLRTYGGEPPWGGNCSHWQGRLPFFAHEHIQVLLIRQHNASQGWHT